MMIMETRTWDSISLPITALPPAPWGPTEVPSQQLHGPVVMASVGGVRVQPREAIKRLLEASTAGNCPTPPLNCPRTHLTKEGKGRPVHVELCDPFHPSVPTQQLLAPAAALPAL